MDFSEERITWILRTYDSIEDPEQRTDFLAAFGIAMEQIQRWRRWQEREAARGARPHPSAARDAGVEIFRPTRRRPRSGRRALTAPPGGPQSASVRHRRRTRSREVRVTISLVIVLRFEK
ncbi:hypothetical protein [Streptomyces sp. YIM S03343]